MSGKDDANLAAILDSIARITEYVAGIESATDSARHAMVFDATRMNFIQIGEMADRLTAGLKEQQVGIDWKRVKDFRNLVAHECLGIDAEEVWQIIQDDLPALRGGY